MLQVSPQLFYFLVADDSVYVQLHKMLYVVGVYASGVVFYVFLPVYLCYVYFYVGECESEGSRVKKNVFLFRSGQLTVFLKVGERHKGVHI